MEWELPDKKECQRLRLGVGLVLRKEGGREMNTQDATAQSGDLLFLWQVPLLCFVTTHGHRRYAGTSTEYLGGHPAVSVD